MKSESVSNPSSRDLLGQRAAAVVAELLRKVLTKVTYLLCIICAGLA